MMKLFIVACLIGAITAATVCGPVCMIYCPYGNVMDTDGCPTCRCHEAPVDLLKTGTEACSPVLCKMYCVNGWAKNDQGCDICSCA